MTGESQVSRGGAPPTADAPGGPPATDAPRGAPGSAGALVEGELAKQISGLASEFSRHFQQLTDLEEQVSLRHAACEALRTELTRDREELTRHEAALAEVQAKLEQERAELATAQQAAAELDRQQAEQR